MLFPCLKSLFTVSWLLFLKWMNTKDASLSFYGSLYFTTQDGYHTGDHKNLRTCHKVFNFTPYMQVKRDLEEQEERTGSFSFNRAFLLKRKRRKTPNVLCYLIWNNKEVGIPVTTLQRSATSILDNWIYYVSIWILILNSIWACLIY